MRVVSCIVAILLLASPAFAISLDEMQKIAVGKREVIKRYEVNLDESNRDVGLARSGYYPSVDFSYTVNQLDEDGLYEDEQNSSLVGAVTWNLFNGLATKYQLKSAKLQKEVQQFKLTGIKQDVRLNVALRYLDVYERQANLEVAKKNYDTLLKIYQDGQNRLDVGLIDKNELLKFKVDLDNSDITAESARAGLDKAVELLAREVGEDITLKDLDFKEFSKLPGKQNPSQNETLMLANRSELLAYDKLLQAAGYQVNVQKAGYYPKVDMLASYTNYDDDFINKTGDVDEDEVRFQLKLSMNLFQGNYTRESVSKAKLEERGLRYDRDELIDDLKTQLKNLHTDYEVSLRNVQVAQVSIEQAEENLRITRLKYEEGLQRESDLLDAVTNLSRAQYNHVSVVMTVFLNYFNIQRMIEAD